MKRLSQEEEFKICEMYKSGKSLQQIHLDTGHATVTIQSVLNRNGVKTRGLKKNVLNAYTDEELFDYYKSHKVSETEKHFNCNMNTIYARIKHLGNKHMETFYKSVNKEQFEKDYLSLTIDEVSEKYNLSKEMVYSSATKLGIHKPHNYKYGKRRKNKFTTSASFIDIQREMIMYLAKEYTSEDIATLIGKTPARVCQILKGE